jgi:hypothetical protein
MSISVLVEKKIASYNYSTVTFIHPNWSISIFGRKKRANFAQIGRILLKLVGFLIFISKFQLKKFAALGKSNREFLDTS